MMNWYCTVFDAHVQHYNPGITFLTYDDEHHRIALVNLSLMKPSDDKDKLNGLVGIDHIAYTYESLTALFRTTSS